MATPDRPKILSGIDDTMDRYDAYIVDLWGVVHDGEKPLPGVVDALAYLREAGKIVCLLSNAPRRTASVAARMAEMGIDDRLYSHLLTSGEATHAALSERADPFHQALGNRCFHIGPPRDDDTGNAPGINRVDRLDEATFVLVTGIDEPDETVDDYAAILAEAADRQLPMVCANPDLVVVVGEMRSVCAGALAAHYESLGARVAYHGKPHAPVYARCRRMIAGTLSGGTGGGNTAGGGADSRILAVGDAFRTDILGAVQAGLDSALVTGHGIHREELGVDPQGHPDRTKLISAIGRYELCPDFVMPGFRRG